MRVVVIGGDAAGMSAASRVRKVDPESDVVVYEAGNYVSYSACGIPFYLSGEVPDFDRLLHYPVSKFREERGIDVRINSRVTAINPGRKEITVKAGDTRVNDTYDRLIIATGARPRIPDAFAGKRNVFTIRTLDDMNAMIEGTEGMKGCIIAGAGYVGLEMAEALTARGIHVTLFQRSGGVLRGIERDFSDRIVEELRENGVEVHLNAEIEEVDDSGDGITVKSGSLKATGDFLFLATGVVPNSEIAAQAGIETHSSGAVLVDSRMRTGIEGIYAAGDVATTTDMVTGRTVYFPLATGSNRSGRIAGVNAAGGEARYRGTARTEVVKVFSLHIARTGLGHEDAEKAGYNPATATIKGSSRASYYPGASPLHIRITGDRESHRLLGCSIMGTEGVAKRIDTVAAALYSGLTVEDMTALDYSYSPPFAPAWEPLGVAADVLLKKLR